MGEHVEVGVNYRDNIYVVSVREASDGKFRGVFSVHKHKPGMDGDSLVTRFISQSNEVQPFDSFDEAKVDAAARARAWIDRQG